MIYLLKNKCPKCGADITFKSGAMFGKDIDDEPDVPWVEVSSNMKRFDTCANRHNCNIRPYVDYDEHYIYEDKVEEEITRLQSRLDDLRYIQNERKYAEEVSKLKCPKCGEFSAYWMSDSHNLWCPNCKAIVI